MRKFTYLALGILVALAPSYAEAGCGRGLLGRLFGRANRAAACSPMSSAGFSAYHQSAGYSSSGSFQSGYSIQQYQQSVSPIPANPRPAPSYQSCPGGQCPTPQSAPSFAPQSYSQNAASFLSSVNSLRARYGLHPLAFGQQMYNDACENNRQQLARGLGHFFMGSARRQNAAWGQSSAQQAVSNWITSPGHLSALLDPNIRFAAIAGNGPAWTFSAR